MIVHIVCAKYYVHRGPNDSITNKDFVRNVACRQDLTTQKNKIDIWPLITGPLTAEARVRTQVSPCSGKSGNGTGFLPSSSFFPYRFHCIMAVHSHI